MKRPWGSWFFTGTFAIQTKNLQIVAEECSYFLDRVRKRNGPMKYLLVYEPHKSGNLHTHAIMHGVTDGRFIRESWVAGWEYTKRADIGTAGYVTKYVTKALDEDTHAKRPRIRVSQGYGAEIINRDPEEVKALLHKERIPKTWDKSLRQMIREVTTESSLERRVLDQVLTENRRLR